MCCRLSYSYALPLGKGKLLFPNAGPLANNVVGGWELSGVVDAQSGQPFSVSYTRSHQRLSRRGQRSRQPCGPPGVAALPSDK